MLDTVDLPSSPSVAIIKIFSTTERQTIFEGSGPCVADIPGRHNYPIYFKVFKSSHFRKRNVTPNAFDRQFVIIFYYYNYLSRLAYQSFVKEF